MGKKSLVKPKTTLRHSDADLHRYMRHKLGSTTEEIAAQDGVSEITIQRSIRTVDAYRIANTSEYLNESMIAVVMKNHRNIDSAISGALGAKKTDKDGKKVDDHQTQLEGVDRAIKIMEVVQPKPQKGISVNVNQQAAISHGSPPPESGFAGYEQRLKKIRAKIDQHNQLPSVTADTPDVDAEIIEDQEEVMASAGSRNTES